MPTSHAKYQPLRNRAKVDLSYLPNEILVTVFQCLSILDILNLTLLPNTRFKKLARKVLVQKLLDSNQCHLRLCFDQENRWKFTVDLKLVKATDTRLAFVPIKAVGLRMYTSKLLYKPQLYEAFLVGPDFAVPSHALVENLIKSSLPLNIKDMGLHQQHYPKQHLFLAYNVTKTPENMTKTRPGERWVELLGFECSSEFLALPKNKLQRVFDTLHGRPMRRQIDDTVFTTSSRLPTQGQLNAVAEIEGRRRGSDDGWWQQKYQFMSPAEKSARNYLVPILGGFTASSSSSVS